jgi:uncharacterized membrane protein
MDVTASALSRVALVGFATGLRSQLGPAMVALTTEATETSRPAALFAGRWAKGLAAAGAVGELVADKLPQTPSRLSAAGFLPRVALGALAGSALAGRRREDPTPWVVAAAVGAVAAAGGTLAGARWRGVAHDRGRADWPAAVTEDLAALALAYAACADKLPSAPLTVEFDEDDLDDPFGVEV